jgi:hypothetical protein
MTHIPGKMKKAQVTGEFVIWIYRFLLIGAIAFALVIIIGNKYTEKFDVRQMESSILSEKIIDCLNSRSNLYQESLKTCLNLNEFNYYIIANITSLETGFNTSIIFGNNDLKVQCDLINRGTKFAKPPLCSNYKYLLLVDDEKMKAELEVDIGKHDKNLQ